jgi:hypothetical protein
MTYSEEPFFSPTALSRMANIQFEIIRGTFNLMYLPELTQASLISFCEALVPFNPNNTANQYTGSNYVGTGNAGYSAGNNALIRMPESLYQSTVMIPSYGITVGNFFHALEPGGALSD